MFRKSRLYIAIFCIAVCLQSFLPARDTADSPRELKHWAKMVWNQPADWYLDPYEKSIFERFKKKYPSPVIESAEKMGNKHLLQLKLIGTNSNYTLAFETTPENKIQHVKRYLPEISRGQLDAIPGAARWVEQFLYRIDAGDSAALMDLLFFNKVLVNYREISSKSNIAAKLIDDFPGVFELREFGIQSADNTIQIQLDAQNFHGITVNLPEHLPGPRDTAGDQEKLYKQLVNAMQKRSFSTQVVAQNLQRVYPNANQSGNLLTVPYLTKKVSQLGSIRYQLNPATNNLTPQVQLSMAGNATMKLNRSLVIPYLGSRSAVEGALPDLNNSLQTLYRQILQPSTDFTARGTLEYRGYKVHTIPLEKSASLPDFFRALQDIGSVYLYPTRIDVRNSRSEIRGIIYVTSRDNNDYHFLEWKLQKHSSSTLSGAMKLVFYPFIRSGEVIQFNEDL